MSVHRFSLDPVEHWCLEKVCDFPNCYPDNLFGKDPEVREEAEEAHRALIEYEDTQELGTESHVVVPEWARPQLQQQLAKKRTYSLVLKAMKDKAAQLKKSKTESVDTPSIETPAPAVKECTLGIGLSLAPKKDAADSGVGFDLIDAQDALIDGSENMIALALESRKFSFSA